MNPELSTIEQEQKKLVLERFKTLNPDLKVFLGGDSQFSIKELIDHVEKEDDFGKNIIKVQMKMLQIIVKGVK